MSSVNRVFLIGRLGKDPECRSFDNGGEVANLSIATSESWKDKASGERKERTEWHKVAITNKALVGVARNYLKKGSQVCIEGSLQTRKWTDKDGVEKYSTEIVVGAFNGSLTLLGSANGDAEPQTEHNKAKANGYKKDNGYAEGNPNYQANDLSDEIPF